MMETRVFGNTGLRVGALGFGAAQIGGADVTDLALDRLLGEAFDAGVNVIDTAPMYAASEEKIGRVLRAKREEILIFTKCGLCIPHKLSLEGFVPRARRKLRKLWSGTCRQGRSRFDDPFYWHPRALERSIDQSLVRLKTDCIDLIQLHGCSEEILRKGDVIEMLQRVREAGKVRFIGYSGDRHAALYAIRCRQFDALQLSINIADQQAIDLAVPLASEQGMGVIAKRPIANAVWRQPEKPENPDHHVYWDRLQELGYRWLDQPGSLEMSIRFTLTVPGVNTAILGTSNLDHLRQNLAFAAAGPLENGEFESIRSRWKQVRRQDWAGQT
jgi:aryl-alcohol dehydrogenase-like predicted oxidoreductase